MRLRLIDVHCHVNFNAYRDDAEAVIRRSLEQGIGMMTVGTQRDTSRAAVEIARAHDGVWAIVGLHPIHLVGGEVDEEEIACRSRDERFDAEYFRQLIRGSGGKAVGLGECGLDYYHRPGGVSDEEFLRLQDEAFRAHLDLAHELSIPVMVHCREAKPDDPSAAGLPSAHEGILKILEEYAAAGRGVRGDVHCFSGGWEQAERYLQLGFCISFTGNITYPPRKKDLAAGLMTAQELARRLPLDRILVETDSPYLAPVPHRGQRNEPAFVSFVAAELARIHGLSPDEMAAVLLANSARLFGLRF